ncbi:hypothetical protein F4781DRAFT_418187 [Annulohypoxylon bovei var. microspora]|nr:hypothetical protein F4781DRAFT_418187 [Annulohypoxylon bovei var. microspora]
MNSSQFPPTASAATPLISSLQMKLVNQIDQGVSYDDIYPTIIEMGEELLNQDLVPVHKMLQVLRNRAQMSLLLHSIPRPVLRSIVMRMVAYDFHDRASDNRKWLYDKEGPGAYIATISVINREGCTWTARENVRVVSLLNKYSLAIETYEKYKSDGGSQLTEVELSAMKVAQEIDKAYPNTAGEAVANNEIIDDSVSDDDSISDDENDIGQDLAWKIPRFACGLTGKRSRDARQLASMLEMRQIPGVDLDVPCKQSVCMVGNAGDVEKRTQAHRLITALKECVKCWGLLVSCLKYANLEVEETIIPVCKTWESKQINMAEILVTVLAGSLLSVSGLNVKQPGTRPEKKEPIPRMLQHCYSQVWRANPWFRENLAHSFPVTMALIEAEEKLGDPPPLERTLDKIQQLGEERGEMVKTLNRFKQTQAMVASVEELLVLDAHDDANDKAMAAALAFEDSEEE